MFEEERKRLVSNLVKAGYVKSPEVKAAMEHVPRHQFLPRDMWGFAHSDTPLNIGEGQTISAPHMVGMMLELLELVPGHNVLEVGGGSGYHASLIAHIVGREGHVYSVEIIESLAKQAEKNVRIVGMHEIVTTVVGDGSKGLKRFAPFDRITAACSAPSIPVPLVEQLNDPGIMVIPVGATYFQELILIVKLNGRIIKSQKGGVAFVPMRGEHGVD
jgi:protein-L-isoaspartate(D-aspartate) O-methyltransferase